MPETNDLKRELHLGDLRDGYSLIAWLKANFQPTHKIENLSSESARLKYAGDLGKWELAEMLDTSSKHLQAKAANKG